MLSIQPGKVFQDRFRIESCFPRSAQGQVGKGIDISTNQPVVAKLANLCTDGDRVATRRFERELDFASSGQHSLRLITRSESGSRHPYGVFECVPGSDLSDHLRSGFVFSETMVRFVFQVLVAFLARLHVSGSTHRDVKPNNVMFDRATWHTRLIDYGLVHLAEAPRLTCDGSPLGTRGYLAPELIERPLVVHPTSDQFSLGATLYECLTGCPAFVVDDPNETVRRTRFEEPDPIHHWAPNVSPQLCRIISRLLIKDPARRYRRIDHALDELQGASCRGRAADRAACLKCGKVVGRSLVCSDCGAAFHPQYGLLFGLAHFPPQLYRVPLGRTAVGRDRLAAKSRHVSRHQFTVESSPSSLPRLTELEGLNPTRINRMRVNTPVEVLPHYPIEVGPAVGRFVSLHK